MGALLILFLILLYTMQSFLCKKYSEYYPGAKNMSSPVFTIVSGFTVAIMSLCLTGLRFDASPLVILLGVINAVVLFSYNTCLIKASDAGPYSVLMVFLIAGGIIIPTLVAAVYFYEPVSLGKIVCIVLILVSVYAVSLKNDIKSEKTNKSFILLCFGIAISNGTYGTLLDIQQRLTSVSEKEEMVSITYFAAMLMSLLYLVTKFGKSVLTAMKQTKKSALYLILCSLCIALAVNALVYALGLVNVTVLYTFGNSGVFLMSVLLSVMFFKEKLSIINKLGCIMMCLCLIGVSLF